MRDARVCRRLAAALTMAISATVMAAPIAAARPATGTPGATQSTFRKIARGANVILSPNCPFGDWLPEEDTVCDTYVVWYVQFAVATTGHPDIAGAEFHTEVEHYTDLVHPDGTFEEMLSEFGFASVAGTFDQQHLTSARMDAVDVPMMTIDPDTGEFVPNGSTTTLGMFTWTAASRVYVWGSDGPALGGAERVTVTPCGPLGVFAHQKDTVGYVTGSINGASISSFYQAVQIPGLEPPDGTGYIFDNAFKFHFVDHCGD
jgi:hypothetical protein